MQVFRVLVVFGVAAVASAQLSAVFDRSAAENAAKTAEEHLVRVENWGLVRPPSTFLPAVHVCVSLCVSRMGFVCSLCGK